MAVYGLRISVHIKIDTLLDVLDRPISDIPFPHKNKTTAENSFA